MRLSLQPTCSFGQVVFSPVFVGLLDEPLNIDGELEFFNRIPELFNVNLSRLVRIASQSNERRHHVPVFARVALWVTLFFDYLEKLLEIDVSWTIGVNLSE